MENIMTFRPLGAVHHSQPAIRLRDLLIEMQGLRRIIPADSAPATPQQAQAVAQSAEDAVEAGFDNLPL